MILLHSFSPVLKVIQLEKLFRNSNIMSKSIFFTWLSKSIWPVLVHFPRVGRGYSRKKWVRFEASFPIEKPLPYLRPILFMPWQKYDTLLMTSWLPWKTLDDGLINSDEKVPSSKLDAYYPIQDLSVKTFPFPFFRYQNGWKTTPFGAAHTYIDRKSVV